MGFCLSSVATAGGHIRSNHNATQGRQISTENYEGLRSSCDDQGDSDVDDGDGDGGVDDEDKGDDDDDGGDEDDGYNGVWSSASLR